MAITHGIKFHRNRLVRAGRAIEALKRKDAKRKREGKGSVWSDDDEAVRREAYLIMSEWNSALTCVGEAFITKAVEEYLITEGQYDQSIAEGKLTFPEEKVKVTHL